MPERGEPRPELAGLTLSREQEQDVEFLVTGEGGGVGLLDRIEGALNTDQIPEQEFRNFFENPEYKQFSPPQREFAERLLMSGLASRGGVDVGKVMAKYRELMSQAGTPPRARTPDVRGSTPPSPPAPAAGARRPTPGVQPAEPEMPFTYPSGGQGKKKGKGGQGGPEQMERAKRADPGNFSLRLLEQEYGNVIRRLPDGSMLWGGAPSETAFKNNLKKRLRTEFPETLYPGETDDTLREYVDGWFRFKLATLSEQGGKGQQKGQQKDAKAIEAELLKHADPEGRAMDVLNSVGHRIARSPKTGELWTGGQSPDRFKLSLLALLRAEFPLTEFPAMDDTKLRELAETWFNQKVAALEAKATAGKKAQKPEERIEERIKAVKDKLRLIGYGSDLLDAETVKKELGIESQEKALPKIVQKLLSKNTNDERAAKHLLFVTAGTKYGLIQEQCDDIYDALKLELIANSQAQEKATGWKSLFRPQTRQGKITKAAAFAGVGVASAVGFGWLGLVATGGLRAIDRMVTRAVDTKLLNQYRERNKGKDELLAKMQNRLAGLIVETKRRALEAERAKERATEQTALSKLLEEADKAEQFVNTAPQLAKEAADKSRAAYTAYESTKAARDEAQRKADETRVARETAEQAKNNLTAAKNAEKSARTALGAAQDAEHAAQDALQAARLNSSPNFHEIEQRHHTAGAATALARTAFDNAHRAFVKIENEANKFKEAKKAEQTATKALKQTRTNLAAHDQTYTELSQAALDAEVAALEAPQKARDLRDHAQQAWQAESDRQSAEHPSERYGRRIVSYLRTEEAAKPDARLRMSESELRGVAERLAVYYAMDDLADTAEREAMEKREFYNISGLQRVGKALAAPIGELPPRERRSAIMGRLLAGGGMTLAGLILNRIRGDHPWAIRLAGAYEGWKLGEAVHETGARLSSSERIEKEIIAAEALHKLMEDKEKPNARLQALDDLEVALGQLSVRLAEFPKETKGGAKFLEWKEKVRELTLVVVAAQFEKREDDITQGSFDAITERLDKLKKPQIEAVAAKNKTFSEKTLLEKGATLIPSAALAKKLTGAAAGIALAEVGVRLADLR